jgi:regulator of sirC expression with transglutaminase-like and TPR domain
VFEMDCEIEELNNVIDLAIANTDQNQDPLERWQLVCATELRLTGDTQTYHDPRNSFLPEIRRRRVGIPIGLAVVWLHVARRLSIDAFGVGMPGHFLVGARRRDGTVTYFDCFGGGRQLTEQGCESLYQEMFAGRQHPSFNEQFLAPVSDEAMLTRMIANLKQHAARRKDFITLLELARLRWFLPIPSLDEGRELVRLCVALGLGGEAQYWLSQVVDKFGPTYPEAQQQTDTKIVTASFN